MSTHTKATPPAQSDTAPDALPERENDELDVEIAALLARGAQDTGEPTEAIRLDTLGDAEKRVLLVLLRQRMGHTAPPSSGVPKENQP